MVNIEAEKIEIERSIKRIEEAEIRKDFCALFEELTEDCIGLVNNVPQIQGVDAWREFYTKFFDSSFTGGSITYLGIEISASGDMAWGHGVFVSEFDGSDGPTKAEGKCLSVYKKVDGKWKTTAVCTTGNG